MIFLSNGAIASSPAHTKRHQEWFLAFLKDRGINVRRGCELARSLARLDEFIAMADRRSPQPTESKRRLRLSADAHGVDFMIRAVRRTIEKTAGPFADHWNLFGKGDPIQNRPGVSTKPRNLLWELLCGALAASFAHDVAPGHPDCDVQCTFDRERWGLECKAFYSYDLDQQQAKLVEGAKQIEASPVDFGMVAVNVANIFPHEEVFDRTMPMRTVQEVASFVNRVQHDWVARFGSLIADGSRLLRGNKTRAAFFACPTIVNVNRVPSIYFSVMPLLFRRIQGNEVPFGRAFATAMETAMTFLPPADNRGLPTRGA